MLKTIMSKLITKVQKLLLKSDYEIASMLYYYLAKKHFKLILNKDLEKEVLNNTNMANMAAKRHSRLVLNTKYRHANRSTKIIVRRACRSSFVKNIILDSKL